MLFATPPNTILRDLGVERPEGRGSDVIDFENTMCMSNMLLMYCIPEQMEPCKRGRAKGTCKRGWKWFTSRNHPNRKSYVGGLKKRIRVTASFADGLPYDVKEEEVLDDIAPANSTILSNSVKEARSFVPEDVKFFSMVYDANFPGPLQAY